MASSHGVGYQGFGSFHSENVDSMVSDDTWVPPPSPVPLPPLTATPPPFGDACKSLFMIDFERWTFLNHGAFGAPCRYAFDYAAAWRLHIESQPLRGIDRELFPAMISSLKELAAWMGADPRDLTFVPNATSALNAVIFSAGVAAGDTVFSLDVGYGSVKKMVAALCARVGARHVEATLDLDDVGDGGAPLTSDAIVALVKRELPAGCRLAVFDAVTSNSALVMPVAELATVCRSRGVRVLIDGAHMLGSAPINLSSSSASYFVSNCHKVRGGRDMERYAARAMGAP